MTRISGALGGALLIISVAASVAAAQQQSVPAGRVPVQVAVTDSANFGQAVVIVRRPDVDPPNFILMSRDAATPRHLAAAAATLSVIMQRDGDRPSAPGLYRVSADATGPLEAIGSARKALARIEGGREVPVDVKGVGRARVTRIYLPDHAARDRMMREGKMRLRVQRPAGGGR